VRWDGKAVTDYLAQHEEALPALVKREVRAKLTTGVKNPKGGKRQCGST